MAVRALSDNVGVNKLDAVGPVPDNLPELGDMGNSFAETEEWGTDFGADCFGVGGSDNRDGVDCSGEGGARRGWDEAETSGCWEA